MSTPISAPRPAAQSSLPGMALVERLEGRATAELPLWARVLPRLFLYALPALWWLAIGVAGRFGITGPAQSPAHARFLFVFAFAWIAAIEVFKISRFECISREHTGATAVVKALCAATPAAWILTRLLLHHPPDAASCVADAFALTIATLAAKRLLRGLIDGRRPQSRLPVAIVTWHPEKASWRILRKEVSRHEIAGAIRFEKAGRSIPLAERYTTEKLVEQLRRERFEGVLVSAPSLQASMLSRAIEAGGGLSSPARLIMQPRKVFSTPGDALHTDCLYLLNTGAAPAGTVHYRFLKRLFDIAFSLVAILIGAPMFIAIALAVKLTSPGKVFFVQERVGWNGRVFRMYKFRTMREVLGPDGDILWTAPEDPRRTAIGGFLRRFSLDELPQFFNVLKGDMSVVGPRPERPFFVSSFRRQIDEYHRRHQLKVGITGWAQVNGLRGDTCIRTRLMYDLYYLQNWGLIFDLKIVLQTVFCIFKGKNAY